MLIRSNSFIAYKKIRLISLQCYVIVVKVVFKKIYTISFYSNILNYIKELFFISSYENEKTYTIGPP